jgi:hypothetical protein
MLLFQYPLIFTVAAIQSCTPLEWMAAAPMNIDLTPIPRAN